MFDVTCLKELDRHFLSLGFETKSKPTFDGVLIEYLGSNTYIFMDYLYKMGITYVRNHLDDFILDTKLFPKLRDVLVEYGSLLEDVNNCYEGRKELTKELAVLESQIVYGNSQHILAFVQGNGDSGLVSDLMDLDLGYCPKMDLILYPIEDPSQLDIITPQLRGILLMLKEVLSSHPTIE